MNSNYNNEFLLGNNHNLKFPRKTAFWAGLFYILTFISIPTFSLYQPIHEPSYIIGNANDHKVVIGGILEIIVALSGIATSIILYSVLKKQNQTLSIGLIAARIVEAGTIFVGVSFLLGAMSLHHKQDTPSSLELAQTLATMYDRMFVLGQGFMPAIDDLLLGSLLFQSRLVPRWLSLIGIVGAFSLFAGYLAIMFGVIDRFSIFAGLSALMVAFFEFYFGLILLYKGIKKD